jgi:hypothetical protein
MIVKVAVNHSAEYDFLLDTGTQVSILDLSLASALHLDASGSAALAGVGFGESVSTVYLNEIAVGAHAVPGQRVLVADLTKMNGVGLHIQGILGEDFLQHFDMLIDNGHGLLCLDDAATMRAGVKGQRLPFSEPPATSADNPLASLLVMSVHFLNGMRPVRLMLDSGSNAPFLYKPSEYLALGVIQGASWHGRGANGEQQAFVALPPQDLKIGEVALSRVLFLAMRREQKDAHAATFDGLLPLGLFRRVFISHNGDFAVLEPKI